MGSYRFPRVCQRFPGDFSVLREVSLEFPWVSIWLLQVSSWFPEGVCRLPSGLECFLGIPTASHGSPLDFRFWVAAS